MSLRLTNSTATVPLPVAARGEVNGVAGSGTIIERRYCPVQDFRMQTVEGQTFFTGYAACFNVTSEILADRHGKFRELIRPGAFSRALREQQDVRHLINHDPNLVLGRTQAGTTILQETERGLFFKTLTADRTYEKDLMKSVERGDVTECSFGFCVNGKDGQRWSYGDDGLDLRELLDVNLSDISIVTYPAYPETTASVDNRGHIVFPDGIPADIVGHFERRSLMIGGTGAEPAAQPAASQPAVEKRDENCECSCESCVAGNCMNCTNTECDDPNCDANWDEPGTEDKAKASRRDEHRLRLLGTIKSSLRSHRATQQGESELRASSSLDGDTLELLLYGSIGEDYWTGGGITAEWIKQQVDSAGPHSKIRMRINSFGGDAFEGVCISNYVKSLGKPIEVSIDGLAASAASVIAMSGDKITMAPNTMLMIHNASSFMFGGYYASDMYKMAAVLDKISEAIAQTYVARTKMSYADIKALLDGETWMTAQDALAKGFCTEISAPGEEEDDMRHANLTALLKRSQLAQSYRNLPAEFRADPSAEIESGDLARQRVQLRARAEALLAL